MHIRIKICCIKDTVEAAIALKYGASALGFVSEMPSGPGVVTDQEIQDIVRDIPPAVGTFLLTSKQNVQDIIIQQRFCRTNTLQLVDEISLPDYELLHDELQGISIVQVIHVTGMESLEQAKKVAPKVHGILLDSGNPGSEVKELGGTGRIHDWEISRQIVESVDKPVFLAGGLHSGNIQTAIETVRPFGIDICSGVRTDDALDEKKLAAFFGAVESML